MGTDEQWETADRRPHRRPSKKKGWPFTINEGDGAFYGPKIDVHLEDCIGPHLAVRHRAARFPDAGAL